MQLTNKITLNFLTPSKLDLNFMEIVLFFNICYNKRQAGYGITHHPPE